ncbi:hypothetical protein EXE44_16090 [Halorubrum sp. SS7]|uniref:SipW-dependent-type signal peptide-containing protein n=1 Tax=unclassified Halorubrum TaxID=2642239 RepID=UPI0010F9E26F|nr:MULTISPECIES: SipW-dependent-type signal peptide-containing protein [unclassified Halorubrum]TKX55668.1 hypothetical protein EXE44_16090 [Halorubrum sp. SS7]TKX56133.1 hypothetical protein EXE42_00815 [Halorubrum sp. SP3]TKX71151.1 hypothetical protein EXE45_02720 [Halorubrum sp. SP9]
MSNNNLELSRRKILGSVGAVGAAGAAAGLGTSALFSDEESFEDNSITAGTLDMTVDARVPDGAINDEWADAVDFDEYDSDSHPHRCPASPARPEDPTAVRLRRWVSGN